MTDRRRRDPGEIPPAAAVERYLKRRQSDSTESSVYAWRYRLKLFVEWLETEGVEVVGQLRGLDLDRYYEDRAAEIAPATLEGEMWTLKSFVEYLEAIGAVDDGLAGSVRIPDVDADQRSNDTKLAQADALALLQYYRGSDADRATRAHAILELAWTTGARQSGLRALDIRDVHVERRFVEFLDRPETGTGLKNDAAGERAVAVPGTTMDVVDEFVREHRYEIYDDANRQPLLASQQGRPTENTFRNWTYLATLPCLHSPCPHGRERAGCSFTEYNHASKCPSSRAPHHVRTGSIGWQLDQGLPVEIVAERVNATVRTIRDHYDKVGRVERMERRRRHYIGDLEVDT